MSSNDEQRRAWDGDTGDFWTTNATRFDEGVAAYQGPLLDAAAIEPGHVVLDVGCGSGRTTRDAARRATDGSALGVDLSARQLDLARRLAAQEGIGNAAFEQVDAQDHPFAPGSFDAVLSRHGSMFFGDPPAAFANLARALRPGGRLVLLTWQGYERQEWLRTFRTVLAAGRDLPALPTTSPSPVSMSEPDVVRALLEGAGFVDVSLRGIAEPMYVGCRAGCSTGWTRSSARGRWTRCAPRWRSTAPAAGCCSTPRAGWWKPGGSSRSTQ
ncbi:class I SAM-dependent methyltransferase [Pseudonocardia saturnea]